MTRQSRPWREWSKDAACLGLPEEQFFNEGGALLKKNSEVCAKCPVRIDCKWFAIENQYRGLYGGLSTERRDLIAVAYGLPPAV